MSSIYGILALLAAIQAANALDCYSCNSKDDGLTCDWGGIVSISYDKQECSSGFLERIVSPKCYKLEARTKDGRAYIARGCLPAGISNTGCNSIALAIGWISSQATSSDDGDSVHSLSCYTCEGDYCNSAQKITGVTIIGLILTAVIFVV